MVELIPARRRNRRHGCPRTKPPHQPRRRLHQQRRVHPHRHEQRARVEVLLRQRRVGGEDAGGLAGGAHGGDAALDHLLHGGVSG
jgi:hypothetical protein